MSVAFPRLGSEPAPSGAITRGLRNLVASWRRSWQPRRSQLGSPFGWGQLAALFIVWVSFLVRSQSADIAVSWYESGSIAEDEILSTAATLRQASIAGFVLAVICCWRLVAWSVSLLAAAGDVIWQTSRNWPPVALLMSAISAALAPALRAAYVLGAWVKQIGRALVASWQVFCGVLSALSTWAARTIVSLAVAALHGLAVLARPFVLTAHLFGRALKLAEQAAVAVLALGGYLVWVGVLLPTGRTAATLIRWAIQPFALAAAVALRLLLAAWRGPLTAAWYSAGQSLAYVARLTVQATAIAAGLLVTGLTLLAGFVAAVWRTFWFAVTWPFVLVWAGLSAGLDILSRVVGRLAGLAYRTLSMVARPVYEAVAQLVTSAARELSRLAVALWQPVQNAAQLFFEFVKQGLRVLIHHLDAGLNAVAMLAARLYATTSRHLREARRLLLAYAKPLWRRLRPWLRRFGRLVSLLGRIPNLPRAAVDLLGRVSFRLLHYLIRTLLVLIQPWRLLGAMAGRINAASYAIHKEVPLMPVLNLDRGQVLWGLVGLWFVGVLAIFFTPLGRAVLPDSNEVVVVHWSNGHLMREGLLPEMAERFNAEKHKTASGRPIVVKPYYKGSAEEMDELLSRVSRGVRLDPKLPDPIIVSPSADHWIVFLNHEVGREVIDLTQTQSIAKTWIGIVTYREMAECLGWPNKAIGYADIVALREDPRGWASYPCAKASWGQRPLVAYTDPLTSSTGRSVLFSLYAIAAGKPAEQLTPADVVNPDTVAYVKQFQGMVDRYLPGTIPLNTQIHQGPAYGHFFLMPEDNLIHLYEGTESAIINGKEVKAPPLSNSMVMIYPKEGSAVHNHSASLVQAPWVSDDDLDAAEQWIAFLKQQTQQEAFVRAGFRPSTDIPFSSTINASHGLDPTKPTVTVNPDRVDEAAAEQIIEAWSEVKKPGIVAFVFDTSGSMAGKKLSQAKDGLLRSIDGMSQNNSVGLITFDDAIRARVEVAPLTSNRFTLAGAIERVRASGNTALYDAVKAGIEMADAAPGDANAIRGVVVLSDGLSNRGTARLQDVVQLMTRQETAALVTDGTDVSTLIGSSLAVRTQHRILVFFIGIGEDADLQVGRLLTEATGAAFVGVTQDDLASVIEEFGKYF